MDIEQQAQNLREQAQRILEESGIVEALSEFGELKVTGSYVLDVMARPDLDLLMISESYSDVVFRIPERILATKKFSEVTFVDGANFSDQDISPSLYYVQAMIPVDGVEWKLDINLIIPEKDRSAEMMDKWKKMLDASPEKRMTILEIKHACREGGKYIQGVDGKLVYKAVLEEGVMSIEDFKKLYFPGRH